MRVDGSTPFVCEHCGKASVGRKGRRFCSPRCSNLHAAEAAKRREYERMNPPGMRERRARLAARDAAYAEAFPACASGAVRGRVSAGGHCGAFRDGYCGDIVRRTVANVNAI